MSEITNIEAVMKRYGHEPHELFYSSCGGSAKEMCKHCNLIIEEYSGDEDNDSYIKFGIDITTANKTKLYCKRISPLM